MPRDREAGFAMLAVMMGVGAILLFVIAVFSQSGANYRNAQYHRREDTILAGAEAMIERYAAKLTIDPLYYRHRVDEAELARRCTDPASLYNGLSAQPGSEWFADCTTWDYEDPGGFYDHPLLQGRSGNDSDDIAALLTVEPPTGGRGVELTVVAHQAEFGQTRAVAAEIRPESVSEFAFLVEDDLRFGSGAVVNGKIYTGANLGFDPSPVQGVVHRDAFAEGRIGGFDGYGPPVFASGAQGYDGIGQYIDIRVRYPDPLDFSKFWDDLELIRTVSCGGGGLCLSRADNPGLGLSSDPTAWLIQPEVSGGVGRLRVSAAYSSNSYSCVSSEEWWWLHSSTANWTHVGTFPIPATGTVWADNHVIVGLAGDTSIVKGALTIYAGSNGSRKNVIIGSDIVYASGENGSDVLALISSDELIINPSSVGGDNSLYFAAAILSQGGVNRVARDCGSDGDVMLPLSYGNPIAELTTWGSFAKPGTGDMAAHFEPRNYQFDPRLEYLRPPLFPLMRDEWGYANWREVRVPCWGQEGGCSS